MDKDTKQLLKQLSKPCSSKNFGGFYAILIVAALLIVGVIWLTWLIGTKLYKLYKVKKAAQHKAKSTPKKVEYTRDVLLENFGILENALVSNKFAMYYSVRSYKNSETELTQYVDFYVPMQNKFVNVTNIVFQYVSEFNSNSFNRDNLSGVSLYTGRSKALKGCAVITGLGLLKLNKVLNKWFGAKVTFVQTEVDLSSNDYVQFDSISESLYSVTF